MQRRRLAYEMLEERCLLAGDVTVLFRGGDLILRGDQLDNQVEISQDDGLLTIAGVDGTTIDGQELLEVTAEFDDVVIRFQQGGEDHVAVVGELELPGDLCAKMGAGGLTIDGSGAAVVIGEDLRVQTRGDVAMIDNVRVAGETTIHAGGQIHVLAGNALLPDFSAAEFSDSLNIDNPYFPLVPGTTFTYEAEVADDETGEVETEVIVVEVLAQTHTVMGVECRVVRDTVRIDGVLVEDTFDWYAQDDNGNVWYMGEAVTNYEYDDEGDLITNDDGSFTGGVDDALPGVAMEADPQVGDRYYLEVAPGVALDQAEVLANDDLATTPAGVFRGVLRTAETQVLEPDTLEHKLYAPGTGMVLAHKLDYRTGEILETTRLISVKLNGGPVPQVVPANRILGPNAVGEITQRVRFDGAAKIRARDAVIVSGTAFGGRASIFSGSTAHVIDTAFARESRVRDQDRQ